MVDVRQKVTVSSRSTTSAESVAEVIGDTRTLGEKTYQKKKVGRRFTQKDPNSLTLRRDDPAGGRESDLQAGRVAQTHRLHRVVQTLSSSLPEALIHRRGLEYARPSRKQTASACCYTAVETNGCQCWDLQQGFESCVGNLCGIVISVGLRHVGRSRAQRQDLK